MRNKKVQRPQQEEKSSSLRLKHLNDYYGNSKYPENLDELEKIVSRQSKIDKEIEIFFYRSKKFVGKAKIELETITEINIFNDEIKNNSN